jgi:Ran GTPase-activating protein (RanGAP) involved in mRNA processing and transport
MLGLKTVYEETCEAATIDPRPEFLKEIEDCASEGRATLDCRIDGGITYHKLEDKDFSVILDTLKSGGTIHSICCPRNNLSDGILPGVAQLIAQSDSITEIDFTANQITGDGGIKTLQEALVQSQSLTHISFAQNEIGDDGCLQIILALRNNRTITHLNLSDTGMSHNALTVLGSIVGQINRLKCLYVDNPHNGIDGDSAAKRLLLSLVVNQSLVELSIARAKIGDDSAFLIGDALDMNSTLKRLRIRSNCISSVGAERIATALKSNTTLEILDISGNKIGDKGAEALAEMLKENRHLTKIDVTNNGIHGVGILALCKAFPLNEAITELALWGNYFVDHSVMDAWSQFAKEPRAATLKLDFLIAYTDGIPYVARTAPVDSPIIWGRNMRP